MVDHEVKIGKQMIYRWLYGENVIKRAENRNIEITDDEVDLDVRRGNQQVYSFIVGVE